MSFIDCIVRSHFNYLANDDFFFFFPVEDVRRGSQIQIVVRRDCFFFGSHCQKGLRENKQE